MSSSEPLRDKFDALLVLVRSFVSIPVYRSIFSGELFPELCLVLDEASTHHPQSRSSSPLTRQGRGSQGGKAAPAYDTRLTFPSKSLSSGKYPLSENEFDAVVVFVLNLIPESCHL